jgi:hypothetical protein
MIGTGFKIDDVKRMFFDREGVILAMSEATHKSLSRAGAFIMTTARGLIRKAKKSSLPGRPPHGHGAELLKKNIFFGFDQRSQSMVVGPARLNGRSAVDIPRTLEVGGPTTIAASARFKQPARKVTLAARPYMVPSLNKNLPKLGGVYANSIRP